MFITNGRINKELARRQSEVTSPEVTQVIKESGLGIEEAIDAIEEMNAYWAGTKFSQHAYWAGTILGNVTFLYNAHETDTDMARLYADDLVSLWRKRSQAKAATIAAAAITGIGVIATMAIKGGK